MEITGKSSAWFAWICWIVGYGKFGIKVVWCIGTYEPSLLYLTVSSYPYYQEWLSSFPGVALSAIQIYDWCSFLGQFFRSTIVQRERFNVHFAIHIHLYVWKLLLRCWSFLEAGRPAVWPSAYSYLIVRDALCQTTKLGLWPSLCTLTVTVKVLILLIVIIEGLRSLNSSFTTS